MWLLSDSWSLDLNSKTPSWPHSAPSTLNNKAQTPTPQHSHTPYIHTLQMYILKPQKPILGGKVIYDQEGNWIRKRKYITSKLKTAPKKEVSIIYRTCLTYLVLVKRFILSHFSKAQTHASISILNVSPWYWDTLNSSQTVMLVMWA